MDFRRTYRAAAVSFADLVGRLPAGPGGPDLSGPGLGDWSLRELLGHTVSAALRQVPEVLTVPAETVVVDSSEGYWALARSAPAELIAAAGEASAADATQTGLSLGADPAGAVGEQIGRATGALAEVGDDDLVTTALGGMRVREWMPTRTLELVVHGLDVAAAAGVEWEPPAAALTETAALLSRVAVAVGDGPVLLRAMTGRGTLPPGFSVVA